MWWSAERVHLVPSRPAPQYADEQAAEGFVQPRYPLLGALAAAVLLVLVAFGVPFAIAVTAIALVLSGHWAWAAGGRGCRVS